jgi:hypothetical protein
MKKVLKALGYAVLAGGLTSAAAAATGMAADGFSPAELRALGAVFTAGGLSGAALYLKKPERDPEARERSTD